ncbi:MAG: AAA family ATPase [archaeon]
MDWTEKYRPVSLDDIVMDSDVRKKLKDFGNSWINGSGNKPLILYGDAGIGKTTSALAMANDYGFNPIEINASNSRTKNDLSNTIGVSSNNYSMSSFGNNDNNPLLNLLIVDEADNLESKSGSNELIKIINSSNMPIILIANDFYAMDKNLRNVCQSVQFKGLNEISVTNTLGKILESEDIIDVDGATKVIANKCKGDIRNAIRILQSSIDFSDGIIKKDNIVCGVYDKKLSGFSLLNVVFKSNGLEEAYHSLINSEYTPTDNVMWIDQNIFTVFNAKKEIDDIVKVYDLLSKVDIINKRVISRQKYRLWRHSNTLLSGVNYYSLKNVHNTGFTKFSFPEHLKILSQNKNYRKNLNNLINKIAYHTHTSSSNIRKELSLYKEIFNQNIGYYIYLFDFTKEEIMVLFNHEERVDTNMEIAEKYRIENEIRELNEVLGSTNDLSEDDIQEIIEDNEENLGKSEKKEKLPSDQMDFSAFM